MPHRPKPVLIEPAINAIRYVTGIMPPVFDGSVWQVAVYEDRVTCEVAERLIVERFALSPLNLKRAAWTALMAGVGLGLIGR